MILQISVLIIMISILYAGTSLRHFAAEGCPNCDCGSENCCEEQEKEEKKQ
jgi:hypothetical protein